LSYPLVPHILSRNLDPNRYTCLSRLLEKVIDLEVQSNTPSPTIDPSVRTILIGHSMGGIVAAETAIALTSEHPVHGSTDAEKEEASRPGEDATTAPSERPGTPNGLMFPYIQGVLAFDTPFLGISPGVVAHGAEEKYVAASSVVAQLGGLAGLWGGTNQQEKQGGNSNRGTAGALPASTSPASSYAASRSTSATNVADRKPDDNNPWNRWGKLAMYAGAVGAVAAGGAAAYMKRDQISTGWGWVSSHLEFVGCLARKEELRRRVAYMVRLNRDLGVGFGNHYTRLGKAASSRQVGMVGTVLGSQRTFCVVPKREAAGDWKEAVNDAATDEIGAHMCTCLLSLDRRFSPADKPLLTMRQLCSSPKRTRDTKSWSRMRRPWSRIGYAMTGTRTAQRIGSEVESVFGTWIPLPLLVRRVFFPSLTEVHALPGRKESSPLVHSSTHTCSRIFQNPVMTHGTHERSRIGHSVR
jgi:hypothetical protein